MSGTLDQRTTETLRRYLREVKTLPNESAKRQRFAALLGELFPGSRAITEYARGVEKLIRITTTEGRRRGHADAYYGNVIIEFEKSLQATLTEAEEQLREYVAGTWQSDVENRRPPIPMAAEGAVRGNGARENEGNNRSLLAVASDGVNWRTYRPVAPEGGPSDPDDVSLDVLREFRLTDDTLDAFWLWLTSVLFREQQIEPTAERFRLDFGSWSPLYRDGMAALKKAWAKVSRGPECRVAFETWQRYLAITYGSLKESTTRRRDAETGEPVSELEDLFLRHTYLATFARLLIWAALSHGRSTGSLREVASEALSGRFFQSRRLANLVDDDFFHWVRFSEAEKTLASAWERVLAHLVEYDLTLIREDVLKGVYQQLIDPKDRHDLGEYYTPDWLCERIVQELLPKRGFSPVLDPSCGSGSFLRAAISHYLGHNREGTDSDRLRQVLGSVVGIDIHPVAVTISRATYVLALGKLISAARMPIQIPVYLADSLFLPREVERTLIERIGGVEITYGSRRNRRNVVVPDMLISAADLFDEAIAACTAVAEEHAKTARDTRSTMAAHLSQVVPGLSNLLQYNQILDALWSFTEGLAELIRERKNTIWSFIIRNSYRPAMMRDKFKFIIGNPPWLSYRFVADPEYQDEIKRRAVEQYRIAPRSQKLFTQMELATVFLAHCMATFASSGARLGFVMPRAVLNGDQHQNLIERRYSAAARLRLTGYWDLKEVSPLFNVPACVLFARRDSESGTPKEKLPVVEWSGKLPSRDVPWAVARQRLSSNDRQGRVIYLGKRSALSTAPGAESPSQPSGYLAAFRQGATVVPRSFYFVRLSESVARIDPAAQYWVETDPEQAAEAKRPYKDVHFSGLVEGKFIYSTAVSRHLMPFALLDPTIVVLPIGQTRDGGIVVRTAEALKREGFREMAKWMRKAEDVWTVKRGDKAEKQSVYEWLDYQSKLSDQRLTQRHLVLYNHSGMNIAATYLDRKTLRPAFIVDVKLYWASFETREEAEYLAAVLNSDTVNDAIKPFQSLGLLGERDIHKKLLEMPIPTFDPKNGIHAELAAFGAKASEEAGEAIRSAEFPAGSTLARQRAFVRDQLDTTTTKIDKLVHKLLEP